ncbi:MAG: hypothetical protein AB7F43_09140 [Bacteriovoracia bacterium]
MSRTIKIQSCYFNAERFEKLKKVISEISDKFSESQKNLVIQEEKKRGGESEEESKLVQLFIQVRGKNGEVVEAFDPNKISTTDFPTPIQKIKINSYEIETYGGITAPGRQRNAFEIILDFSSVPVFDLVTNPSKSTENESSIYVKGEDSFVVQAAYDQLVDFFSHSRTFWVFIHKESIYEFLKWFVAVPIGLLSLKNLDGKIQAYILSSSEFLTIIYVILFAFGLFLFRLVFNWARWLFPYVDFDLNRPPFLAFQRYIFAVFSGGLIGTYSMQLFKSAVAWIRGGG